MRYTWQLASAITMGLALFGSAASAQEIEPAVETAPAQQAPAAPALRLSPAPTTIAAFSASAELWPTDGAAAIPSPRREPVVVTPAWAIEPRRPGAVPPLYASLTVLHGLDLHSTFRAVDRGAGTEANPIMRRVLGHRVAAVAVKAGATAVTVYALERLWKVHGKRKTAVAVLLATNTLLAVVVARNYRLAEGPGR